MRKLLSALFGLLLVISASATDPPNVVFILADDLGVNDLSLYGSTFHETPNIDAFAFSGIRSWYIHIGSIDGSKPTIS